MNLSSLAQIHIIDNLTEGVMVTDRSGTILYANQAVFDILSLSPGKVTGQKFASLFFDEPENDAFSQTVLDAIHAKEYRSVSVVPYQTGREKKRLRVYVSVSHIDEVKDGFILTFTDLTRLNELNELSKDFTRVSRMNRQLTMRNELLQKTFGMYVSDKLVNELLDSQKGPQLGGVKQNLTVMMSDLRGFTALSEQMDADNLISMLNHYLSVMTGVIQRYNGTIIEFIGDGIMAIFGAPVSSATHAADAVAAAVGMQEAMSRVNQWNGRRGYPKLEMGIGLNTGEVIVGNVGSKKRMKYGVVGDQVNLCGRIESYTIGGQVLISPSVREAVSYPLTIEREITVLPKGAEHEIILSHVTGIGEPYNVFVRMKSDTLKKLSEPLPVSFSFISGKHIQDEIHYGGLVQLGKGSALLSTETELVNYDNLHIRAGGRLLCKVLDRVDEGYHVQFTSIPSGFSSWVKLHS